MRCPVCGCRDAQIVNKRGKGKFNVLGATAGALLTGGVGAIALGGMSTALKEKGYLVCPYCGYDQYKSVDPTLVIESRNLHPLDEGAITSRFVCLRELQDRLSDTANANRIPVRVRLSELSGGSGGSVASYPCLVLENPNHPTDYCKICITIGIDSDGERCVFTPYIFGESRQLSMIEYNENAGRLNGAGFWAAAAGAVTGNRRLVNGGLGFEAGYRVVNQINTTRNNQQIDYGAAAFEKEWYGQIGSLFETVVRGSLA